MSERRMNVKIISAMNILEVRLDSNIFNNFFMLLN